VVGEALATLAANTDIAGIELGGGLKNIFALAAGICDGLGLGDNSKAALVTLSLAELTRLGTGRQDKGRNTDYSFGLLNSLREIAAHRSDEPPAITGLKAGS
jgi:glycerol-3-phosphate dehydrogenase